MVINSMLGDDVFMQINCSFIYSWCCLKYCGMLCIHFIFKCICIPPVLLQTLWYFYVKKQFNSRSFSIIIKKFKNSGPFHFFNLIFTLFYFFCRSYIYDYLFLFFKCIPNFCVASDSFQFLFFFLFFARKTPFFYPSKYRKLV